MHKPSASVSTIGMNKETELRQGCLGIKLASGEQVLTASGCTTTPFPNISLGSVRKNNATLKRVDAWLISNALAEADARRLPMHLIQAVDLSNLSQSDRDLAEMILFDDQTLRRSEQLATQSKALRPLVQAVQE